jgi:hypothetical protein
VVPLGAIVVGILVGVAGRRLGLRVVSAGER